MENVFTLFVLPAGTKYRLEPSLGAPKLVLGDDVEVRGFEWADPTFNFYIRQLDPVPMFVEPADEVSHANMHLVADDGNAG